MNEVTCSGVHSRCSCRRCKLVRFAEQVEQLLKDETWDGQDLTSEEYSELFVSKTKELHQELVNGK